MFGSYSNSGLGFGLAFTLQDFFTRTGESIRREMGNLEDKSSTMVANVNREFSRLASGAKMMAVGGAILLGFSGAIDKSMEFNAAMSSVQSKAEATRKEFDLMRQTAIDLGGSTKFTAVEAAQGMDYLAMSGFKANQIVAALPGVLNLAAAGNLGLAKTSEIASNLIISMGLEAGEMTRIADVMAKTVNTSSTEISDLGDSMKYAAPRAAQLGVSIEQLAALTGMMGDIGLKGSLAGTAIREFFTNISRVKDERKLGAFAKIGMSLSDIVDQKGNMRDMNDIVKKMITNFKGMGNIDTSALSTEIFGVGGDSVVAALLGKSAKDFDAYVKQLKDAGGSANKIANTMLDNLAGDVEMFSGAMDSAKISIGSAIEPMLRPIVRWFTRAVDAMNEFVKSPLGQFLAKVVFWLGVALTALGAIKVALAVARLAMFAFGTATWTALAPLLPVIAIIAAVVAVVGGLVYIVGKANDAFENMKEKGTGFTLLLQKLGGFIATVKEVWNSWDRLNETFALTPDLEKKLDMLGIKDTALAIGTWVVRIKEFFLSITDGFRAGMGVVQEIKAKMQPVFDKINSIMDSINLSIGKNTTALDTFKTIGVALGYILAFWIGAVMVLIEGLKVGIYVLVTAVTYLITKIVEGFTMAWQAVGDFFTGVINISTEIYDAGKNLIMSFWEGMKSIGGEMATWVKDLFLGIPGMEFAIKGVKLAGQGIDSLLAGDSNAGAVKNTAGDNIGTNQAIFQGQKAQVRQTPTPGGNKAATNMPPFIIHNNLSIDGDIVTKKVNEINSLNSSRE